MAAPREDILRVVREVIAPLIQADGGEIYVVSASDEAVSLHLGGRYSGCPGNTLTRRHIIAPAIHSAVPGASVTVSSGPLIPDGAERVGLRGSG